MNRNLNIKKRAESFIESYFENIDENEETLKQAIIDLQKEKRNFKQFGYLFDYEVAIIYHYDFEDFENGKLFYLKALKDVHEDDNIRGEIYFNIGTLMEELKDYEESNKYYNLCLDLFVNRSDLHAIKFSELSLRGLGYNYEEAGDYIQAIEYYQKADQVSRGTQFSGIGQYCLAALYHHKLSEYEKALSLSLKAEKLLKEEFFQIGNYQLLSAIYSALYDYEKALAYAYTILEKFPEYEDMSSIYKDIALVYVLWRKEEKGISFLQKALKALVKNHKDYNSSYISIQSWIARAYEGKGDLTKALDVCSGLLEEFSFTDQDIIDAVLIEGSVLQKMGKVLDGYSALSTGLENYKRSQFFNKNNTSYREALEIKKELYNKLPILNRFFERLKDKYMDKA